LSDDTSLRPRLLHHPDGITAVDAQYLWPGHAAAHIIVDGGRAAFVDVGTRFSVPYLLAALRELGITPGQVDYVLITHVHLDHAGGAGALLAALPQAVALVHPRGAGHLIDPTQLIEGSKAVYGAERFNSLYGTIVPMPAERVREVADGERIRLGQRELLLLHSPGHALHHYVIVDAAHHSVFSGDTFGISYRELDTPQGAFIIPTTTPTQFDPEQLIASIERIESFQPASVYLMHYSRVTGISRLAAHLKEQIPELVSIALAAEGKPAAHEEIREAMWQTWRARLNAQGSTLPEAQARELLAGDLELNTQGLLAWLARRKKLQARAR
jgi:glyoxylase-like metal-dependent hydrolase (beta-lactamase superfamily II)